MNYYNEFDKRAAAWLRELIAACLIPPGDVDERSITEVQPHELSGYTQCHFFAGIGGWSLALKLAGWPATRPVWTGSCPCQPFSAAGKQLGTADERHLWPVFHRLIAECRPPVVFGEQVASKLGREWLAGVRADLERVGHAVGAADLCAPSCGAPHIRQRLFWVADAQYSIRRKINGPREDGRNREDDRWEETHSQLGTCGEVRPVADADGGDSSAERQQRSGQHGQQPQDGGAGGLEHAASDGRIERRSEPSRRSTPGGCGDNWDAYRIIHCTDGKARRAPVEPEFFPLVDGVPGRVGLLRGYGNAIVPQVAAQFVRAYLG